MHWKRDKLQGDECVIQDVQLAGVKWLVITHVISIRIDTIGFEHKIAIEEIVSGNNVDWTTMENDFGLK